MCVCVYTWAQQRESDWRGENLGQGLCSPGLQPQGGKRWGPQHTPTSQKVLARDPTFVQPAFGGWAGFLTPGGDPPACDSLSPPADTCVLLSQCGTEHREGVGRSVVRGFSGRGSSRKGLGSTRI